LCRRGAGRRRFVQQPLLGGSLALGWGPRILRQSVGRSTIFGLFLCGALRLCFVGLARLLVALRVTFRDLVTIGFQANRDGHQSTRQSRAAAFEKSIDDPTRLEKIFLFVSVGCLGLLDVRSALGDETGCCRRVLIALERVWDTGAANF
jgi:hypothetical protein